jgi:hypothetical protein
MNKDIRYIKIYFVTFICGFTVLVFTSLLVFNYQGKEECLEYAEIECRSSFNKDLLYRRWASMHGGLYVPITENTPPNENLAFIPERDITTPSGVKLTLMNPAYMTRQVFDVAHSEYGVQGHITSLNPIRPLNKADNWETRMLKLFEKGLQDTSSIEVKDGEPYLRYIKAMVTEQRCMKCHAAQGYKVGEIRGGISVSVPMKDYLDVYHSYVQRAAISHSLFFILVLLATAFAYKRFYNELVVNNQLRVNLIKNEIILKEQNEEYESLNEELKATNLELIVAKEKPKKPTA